MQPQGLDARSLGEVVRRLEAEGYRGQMAARPGGRLMCFTCRRESAAGDVSAAALERVEGASDPDDMLAVAAVTCPHCGAGATVVLGYGPEADENDADVLATLSPPPAR
jgi:hypothetical protein